MRVRFYDWLMRRQHRQDPTGALARDVAKGGGLPSGDAWMRHWMGQTTDEDHLIARWRAAWEEWEANGDRT
jgi:hypothetical protein